MVTYLSEPDQVFRALGDPVRWEIVNTLADGPSAVRPLAERFSISRPAISRHLRVLSEAGLVTSNQVGRNNVYRLRVTQLQEAEAWLTSVWRGRLRTLKRLAEGGTK